MQGCPESRVDLDELERVARRVPLVLEHGDAAPAEMTDARQGVVAHRVVPPRPAQARWCRRCEDCRAATASSTRAPVRRSTTRRLTPACWRARAWPCTSTRACVRSASARRAQRLVDRVGAPHQAARGAARVHGVRLDPVGRFEQREIRGESASRPFRRSPPGAGCDERRRRAAPRQSSRAHRTLERQRYTTSAGGSSGSQARNSSMRVAQREQRRLGRDQRTDAVLDAGSAAASQ